MLPRFLRGPDAHPVRSRMLAERERVRRELEVRAPDAPQPDPPWWKEMLGIGTKREWVLVVVGLLLFALYTYEHEGARQALWAFTTAVSGLLIGRWWTKRNDEESESTRGPVSGPGESGRHEPGVRD